MAATDTTERGLESLIVAALVGPLVVTVTQSSLVQLNA